MFALLSLNHMLELSDSNSTASSLSKLLGMPEWQHTATMQPAILQVSKHNQRQCVHALTLSARNLRAQVSVYSVSAHWRSELG